jgi:halocyanin-like protein
MNTDHTRRDLLGLGGTAVAAALAGCSGGGGGTETVGGDGSGGTATAGEPFGGYLSAVQNFDGVVDRTGTDRTTVKVGVENGQGAFGFGPAALRVSTGTEVVWEWTGRGASHNVVAEDGRFESQLTATEGHTYTRTFESPGTVKYYCQPHRSVEMKGVVVVE